MNDVMNNKIVRYAVIAVLVLLALFLLVKTVDGVDEIGRSSSPITNTITVSGEGRASAVPDIARITYTVMESAANVADAQARATEKNDAALAAIEDLDIKDEDVRTLSYNVSPQYDYGRSVCGYGMPCPPSGTPTITGYQVSQTVEVKVRDTEKASEALGKLGSIGVQNIYGPEFTLDNPDEVRAEAREEAIEKARAQAKTLADQLGVRLGKVVSYIDNNQPYPMYGYGMGGGMDSVKAQEVASPTLPVGQNEYTANVSVTYEIK